MSSRQRSRLRRLRRLLLILLVLAVCLVVAGKFWIVPELVRRELHDRLRRGWDGRVEVGRVEVNLFGPLRLERVAFHDIHGRTWLEAEDLAFTFRDWPGTHPWLTDVDVGRATIRGWVRDGRVQPPIKPPDEGTLTLLRRYVDLQAVRLADARLTIVDEAGNEAELTDFGVTAVRRGQRYRVHLTRPPRGRLPLMQGGKPVWVDLQPSPQLGPFKLAASVDPETLRGRIEVRLAQDVPGEQGAAILSALRVGGVDRAGGRLVLTLEAEGPLTQPASLRPEGIVRLSGWKLHAVDGEIAHRLDMVVAVRGYGGRVAKGTIVTDAGQAGLGGTTFRYDPRTGRLDADLALEMRIHQDKPTETFWSRLLWFRIARGRAALAGPLTYQPGAKVPLQVDLQGWMDLQTVQPPTTATLTIWRVRSPNVHITHDRVRIAALTGEVYGGRLKAELRARRQARGRHLWTGVAEARDVDLPRLTRVLSPKRPMSAGKGSATVRFSVRAGDLGTLKATGSAFADNADVWHVPVLSALFQHLSLPLRATDAEVAFTMEGPVATITTGRLANPVSAIVIEPGGTVDLQKQHVDLFVVVAPLKHLRSLLGRLPLVRLLVMAQEKLVRVRLKGPWGRHRVLLVTEAPLKAITDATLGIFKQITEGGGQLGQELFKPLEDLLKGPTKKR